MYDRRSWVDWKSVSMFLLLIIIMCAVSEGDYKEALQQQKHYCLMIGKGHWPDYKDMREACEKLDLLDR